MTVLVAAGVLAACTHSGSGGSGSAGSADIGGSNNGAASIGDAGGMPAAPAGSVPSAPPGNSQGRHGEANAADAGKLTPVAKIRTAQLAVAVKGWQHVAQQADAADAIAIRAGGQVTADDRSSGKHATAMIVVQVPPAAMQPTLTALSRLGHEKWRHSSTVDVTQHVADVSSRVASAEAAIAQLRKLYRRASRVRDIIVIEQELASREADLESLQAQQRALTDETAHATITLNLVTAPVVTHKRRPAPSHHRGGFVGGLERGWHAFTAALSWLAVAFGTLLPFLVVLLLVGAAAWQLRRRARRSGGVAPPAATSE